MSWNQQRYYRQAIPGLWKDNQASYKFHTPVEYNIIYKNLDHYKNDVKYSKEDWESCVTTLKKFTNAQNISDQSNNDYFRGRSNVEGTHHLIQIISLGPIDNRRYSIKMHDEHTKQDMNVKFSDYAFWIERRMIRRGPNSWKRKTNRWIHEETAFKSFKRAVRGDCRYRPSGYWWY